jgi:hypothetical protein
MCYYSQRYALLQERFDRKKAQWNLLQDAIDGNTESAKKSVSLDTGAGRISYSHLSPDELLKMSSRLESELDSINRKLCGRGVTTTTLRRHG